MGEEIPVGAAMVADEVLAAIGASDEGRGHGGGDDEGRGHGGGGC